jgi:hypothetical protein
MLPDFRKARAGLRLSLNKFLKERTKVHNHAFKDVRVRIIHEGTGSRTINAESNFEHDMDLTSIESSSSVDHDDLINDPTQVFRMLDDLAKQMAEQQGKLMVQAVSDVTERTGRVSKRKGKITPETILDVYGELPISFDQDGRADLPTIYCAPEMVHELQSAGKQLQTDPVFIELFQQLLAKKKQEWHDRENNRKLVG